MIPTVKLEFGAVKIFFGDVLHLSIKRSDLLGIQSWKYRDQFCIEYTLKGGDILTEYEHLEHFEAILKGLEKVF